MAVSLCLSMIVKDEAHIVAESLECVAPYINTWVVVDTGSTDNTIEVVRSFFAARGIPGEVHQRPWTNFGVNRTEALELCQGRADYTWVMDADDVVVGLPDFSNLTLDSYLLKYGSSFRYWRKQIFRSNLCWKYEGVVHEYPVGPDEGETEGRLEGDYHIESRRLGARSLARDKYQRDAETLLEVVLADPDNARATFYLAQSYLDAGDAVLALKYYARRAELGGFDEEVFFSLLRCGECLERLEEPWEKALGAYLRCWECRPRRAEPLHRIAKYYRSRAQYHLAYLFAERASRIPFPDGDVLFVAASVYEWEIDDELSIAAYYIGRYEQSFDLANSLLEVPSVPEVDRERILANRDFAAHFVKDQSIGYPHSIIERLQSRPAQAVSSPEVTLTVTSCRRFELFERTINSFLNCCTDLDLIGRWICIDDGSTAEDRALMKEKYPFFEFVFKSREEKGHARSMNMLLSLVTSPFWLHLEDDWQFIVKSDYISKALGILDDDHSIGQVLFNRNYGETLQCRSIQGGWVHRGAATGIRYRLHEHIPQGTEEYERHLQNLAPGSGSNVWWPHYSLRPSLLRMSAIREVGSYSPESDHFELDFAHRYTALGHRSAFLDSINCLHIGRLTFERGLGGKPNAYELNDERQFEGGGSPTRARVKLLANWTTSEALGSLWDRQSEGGGRWGEIEIADGDGDIDYWAIINFPRNSTDYYQKDRTVVFQMEPWAGVSTWGDWASPDPREFLQVRGHNRYRNNSEWHLDLSLPNLLARPIEKTRDLSCVTSGKTHLTGQQLRILFLKYLEECGTPIDIFGSDNTHQFRNYQGVLPAHNKNEGILPFRYTIAIENSTEVNYFTEKIVDAIVGECLCFYWGCPNVEDYIDPEAFIRLPLDDFEESRRIIERTIQDGGHGKRLEVIKREKRRILTEYQFFPTIARIIRGHRLAERLTIRVLNLDRRPDRWERFREGVLEKAGPRLLERCERMAAIDGTTLVIDAGIRHTFRGNDFNYRGGIVACALGHLEIWKQVAAAENSISLILEDDVSLADDFYGQLVEVCGALTEDHPDFDVVILGYQMWEGKPAQESRMKRIAHLSARLSPMEWEKYLGGTFAYLLSSRGARRMLAMAERDGIQQAIDWFVMRKGDELEVLQCMPHIVEAPLAIPGRSGDSDIQHDFHSIEEVQS